MSFVFFFFNDSATTEIYTLSLHDALPISTAVRTVDPAAGLEAALDAVHLCARSGGDRKSTRLNSSHANISYAVFCLKKKKKKQQTQDLLNHIELRLADEKHGRDLDDQRSS